MIPAHAHVQVDCRVPPGLGEDVARARLEDVLGHDGFTVSFDETVEGTARRCSRRSRPRSRRGSQRRTRAPASCRAILPGFTDSRWFRNAFPECLAYGFFPHRHMRKTDIAPLIHGKDERIDVRDLGFAATFYRDIAKKMLG